MNTNEEGMRVERLTDKIYHLLFKQKQRLGQTFCRAQEHYEGPNLRGKVFTMEEFIDDYVNRKGKFNYFDYWDGFNIPSSSLKPLIEGRFNPLTKKETGLVDMFRSVPHPYYVIGTLDADKTGTLTHEIGHGLYFTIPDYKKDVADVLRHVTRRVRARIDTFLRKEGYHPAVWEDETHAYLLSASSCLTKAGIDREQLKPHSKALRAIFKEHYARERITA